MRRFGMALCLSSCAWAQEAPGQAEIAQWVARVLAKPQMEAANLEYMAEYREVLRRRGWFGSSFREKVFSGEAYLSHRRNINVLTKVDGQPLSNDETEANRKNAVRQMLDDLKAQPEKLTGEYGTSWDDLAIYPYVFLRQSRWLKARWEDRQGRRTLVLDFEPGPGETEPYAHLKGTLWIDVEDLRLAEIMAYPLQPERAGEVFFHNRWSRQPEGVWQYAYSVMNPGVAPKLFGNRTWTHTVELSHFHRFDVEQGQLERLSRP